MLPMLTAVAAMVMIAKNDTKSYFDVESTEYSKFYISQNLFLNLFLKCDLPTKLWTIFCYKLFL